MTSTIAFTFLGIVALLMVAVMMGVCRTASAADDVIRSLEEHEDWPENTFPPASANGAPKSAHGPQQARENPTEQTTGTQAVG